jgi:hypothetical protein
MNSQINVFMFSYKLNVNDFIIKNKREQVPFLLNERNF